VHCCGAYDATDETVCKPFDSSCEGISACGYFIDFEEGWERVDSASALTAKLGPVRSKADALARVALLKHLDLPKLDLGRLQADWRGQSVKPRIVPVHAADAVQVGEEFAITLPVMNPYCGGEIRARSFRIKPDSTVEENADSPLLLRIGYPCAHQRCTAFPRSGDGAGPALPPLL
jgi:hypothetical protein